ncbi:hypothetical protein BKA67DRAFT_551611 [Truncatella angustata]|uniref:Uncharacterized protein n=1 Tax=Truncatella angustata TaxID=152316 RepID=A0A9P8UQ65_9PEZI|nr:uncharacterized protein BKA67DRAFT_551611 [Truncatella angustata]KAH6656323.1 hypothetical protein BKA67DRAFT_551611 [Truncatella angustata]
MEPVQNLVNTDYESVPLPWSQPAPFAIFPYKPLFPNLLTRVDQVRSSGFYGFFNADLLASQAADFIRSNSDADQELLVQVMRQFLNLAKQDCLAGATTKNVQVVHSCWLDIRMTLPIPSRVVPRWHTDGRMFDCKCPTKIPHSKYAFTIMGPSTRIIAPNPAATEILEKGSPTGRRWDQNQPDPELAETLARYEEVAIRLGQIIRFSWNQPDSPIHSEPDSSGLCRVFVSVLFGSEEELRDMCDFRGEKYNYWN